MSTPFGSYWIRQFDDRLQELATSNDIAQLDELASEFHEKRVEMDRRMEAATKEIYRRLKAGKPI